MKKPERLNLDDVPQVDLEALVDKAISEGTLQIDEEPFEFDFSDSVEPPRPYEGPVP